MSMIIRKCIIYFYVFPNDYRNTSFPVSSVELPERTRDDDNKKQWFLIFLASHAITVFTSRA